MNSSVKPPKRSCGSLRKRRILQSWPEGRDFRILSLDGGGIKGTFQAALLAELEAGYLNGTSIAQYFDLVVGNSTGGIIALGLGAGIKSAELRDVYLERGCEIFPPGTWKRAWIAITRLVRFGYDHAALVAVLYEILGDRKLDESQVRLCIPACEGRYGEIYVFKTPHHPDFQLDGSEKMTTVAEATSAAPTFFRALEEGGYTFIDGGVWANNPIMVGLVDTLTCFSVPREQIRILSLGCGNEPYRVERHKKTGGKLQWRSIFSAAVHFQSLSALNQARLLVGASNVRRVEPFGYQKCIKLDDWAQAQKELPEAAKKVCDKVGEAVFSEFLQEPALPYHPLITCASYPLRAVCRKDGDQCLPNI